MTAELRAPTPEKAAEKADWKPTACILCECNCGIEVRLGHGDATVPVGPPRRFERIRNDKAHPASKGYTCEKALRLDHYQERHEPHHLAPAAPGRRQLRGDRPGHCDPRSRRAIHGGA